MANSISFNPQASSPFQPAQTSPTVKPERTSAGLILNITGPFSGFAGDNLGPVGGGAGGTAAAAPAAPTAADSFQRANASAPFVPNPNATPEQQLQDLYNHALNTRNNSEQARNNYLNFANQVNGQSFQNKFTQQPPASPFGQNPAQQQQFQQQLQQLQQMQQQAQLQQQQAAQQAQQLQQQQAAQQAQLQQQQMMQQQPQMDPMMQQQMMQQQQAMDPMMQQQTQQPQGFAGASTADLNGLLAQPQSPQQMLDAINELAMRQQGDRDSYELLKQIAGTPTPNVPPQARQAALFALGQMNRVQNAQVETRQLPGLAAINQIISNPKEDPGVKAAAVAALGFIERPQDPTIQNLLKKAAKDKDPNVQNAVKQVQSGMMSGAAVPA